MLKKGKTSLQEQMVWSIGQIAKIFITSDMAVEVIFSIKFLHICYPLCISCDAFMVRQKRIKRNLKVVL